MASQDHRTLTNQPDPPDYTRIKPKRVRTQIHRRGKTTEPLLEQWNATTGEPPKDLRTSSPKTRRQTPPSVK